MDIYTSSDIANTNLAPKDYFSMNPINLKYTDDFHIYLGITHNLPHLRFLEKEFQNHTPLFNKQLLNLRLDVFLIGLLT